MSSDNGVYGAFRRRVMKANGYTCAACGLVGFPVKHKGSRSGFHTPIKDVYLSIDHIVPRHHGGSDDSSNLQVLCTICNTDKGTKLDWPHGKRPGEGIYVPRHIVGVDHVG